MSITNKKPAPWLLLIFRLPTTRASQRVEVWRKLQRYGALPLRNAGYLLPNNAANRERFEWLATAIRNYKGEASVVEVQAIDNWATKQLAERFRETRTRDYQVLVRELEKILSAPPPARTIARLSRLRHRYQEIVAIDFFHAPLRSRIEELLARADTISANPPATAPTGKLTKKNYRNKLWVTRPRPEIDRAASAWLIRRFIDRNARFAFATDARKLRAAVPFDMFHGGFGHWGENTTFEILQKQFQIKDRKVSLLAQIVHDADLSDQKFGRAQGIGIDQVLKGWARQGAPDGELLRRGMQLIEGLYHSLP